MSCVRWRFVIAAMISLTFIFNFMVRGNMSINILAMTKPLYNTTDSAPYYGPRYEWSAYDQSLVLGSYAWGTVMVTFIAGVFAEKFGPRKVVGCAMISGAILTALAPVAANFLWLSIVIRLLTGISMGAISPSIQALIANWAPIEEKGNFLSLLMSNALGTVINWTISGYIIEYLGWHYAFYINAFMLGIHIVLWFVIVYDSPMNHPRISANERKFIISNLSATPLTKKHDHEHDEAADQIFFYINACKANVLWSEPYHKPWPPLTSMFISSPVWALVTLHFGYAFSYHIFFMAAPKYMNEVHHFAMEKTGVLSSIPYLATFLCGIGFGFLSDYFFNKKILSTGALRKCFSMFSHLIPGFFLIGLSYVGNRPYVALTLVAIALGLSGAHSVTTLQNVHDIGPNFATTIFAISNTFASTCGFLAPLMVAHFTQERSTDAEWRKVFLVGAGLLIGSDLIFIVFGSGKVQKWNEITNNIDEAKEETGFLTGTSSDDNNK